MRQEVSFANLGRILAIFCVVFYAGFIFQIAQAWCDFILCPVSMMVMFHDQPSPVVSTDDSLCAHTPTSLDSMLISHISLDWAPQGQASPTVMIENRFEFQPDTLKVLFTEPRLLSPPPRSTVLS